MDTNEERRAHVGYCIRRIVLGLVAIAALIFVGTKAVASEQPIPDFPVWMDEGLFCGSERDTLQAIDEMGTPLPYPASCGRLIAATVSTVELIGTHQAKGYIFAIVRFTMGGYRVQTPYGFDFFHFYEDGQLILKIMYGYWFSTKIEGGENAEPVGTAI